MKPIDVNICQLQLMVLPAIPMIIVSMQNLILNATVNSLLNG